MRSVPVIALVMFVGFGAPLPSSAAPPAQLTSLTEMRAYVQEAMTVVKPMTVEFFQRHRIPVWPGAANFIVVRPDGGNAVVGKLRDAGILVRPMGAPGLAGTFRMSIGTEAEMAHVLDVYAGLVASLAAKRPTSRDDLRPSGLASVAATGSVR